MKTKRKLNMILFIVIALALLFVSTNAYVTA